MKRFTQMTERNMSKANGGVATVVLVGIIGTIVVGAAATDMNNNGSGKQ